MFIIHIKISSLLDSIGTIIWILVIRTAGRSWFDCVYKINKFAIIRVSIIRLIFSTTSSCLDLAALL